MQTEASQAGATCQQKRADRQVFGRETKREGRGERYGFANIFVNFFGLNILNESKRRQEKKKEFIKIVEGFPWWLW